MTNEVKMSNYYDGIYEVFNPPLVYEGNYIFLIRSLYECSKKKNGKNLVEEYFYNNYIKEIISLIKEYENLIGDLFLISDLNVDGEGRSLKVSLGIITQRICLSMVDDIPELGSDYSTYKEKVGDFFKNYKKAITCLQRKELNNELKDYITRIENLYSRNEEFRKEKHGNKYVPMDFFLYLEKLRSKIVEFLVVYKRLVNVCNKEVNLKELEDLLDLDQFYFTMAKLIIENNKVVEKTEGKLHYSFSYVDVYIEKLKYLMETYSYDIVADVVLLDGKIVKLSAKDLIREYNVMKNRHPECRTVVLDGEAGVNYQDIRVFNGILTQIETAMKDKELSVSWKLFKKGEREDESSVLSKVSSERKEKTDDEKNEELRRRIDFFESSSYLYRVEGINNFEGYIGYIYDNGYVIFEKFYKSKDGYELALGNATYIMNFANFIEMSKLSKLDIIEYIKAGNTDIIRRYHTSNWAKKIEAIINGVGYDVDTTKVIENLIKNGEINNRRSLNQ